MEVAETHLNLPIPKLWDDTLLLAFLCDPRRFSLSLKPMAEDILNLPPDEQEELKDWIIENYMKPNGLRKYSQWGAYIAYAPGKLVGKYAIGDVDRTAKLYRHFYKEMRDAGMQRAYDREQRIIAVKLDMERQGIRIAPKIKRDYGKWMKAYDDSANKIRRKLRVGKDFNPGSNPQLAQALVDRGKLSKIVKTAKGNISTKRTVLQENCNDPDLLQLLVFHGILGTYTSTFLEPWLHAAQTDTGLIYPTFNTIRSTDEYGGKGVGTRTGRFSSSNPNFQNVPADIEESQHAEDLLALRKYLRRYDVNFIGLRDYIIPKNGHVFIARDYSQQELRILAHYEDGELLRQYLLDPTLDIHEFVRQLIHTQQGILYPRKYIKVTVFGLVYGMGKDKLAMRLKIPVEEAVQLKESVLKAIPGVKWLDGELKALCKRKLPTYTWGGRRYYAEPDTWVKVNGVERRRRWWYKMLNLLIQGSAADATKQGMLNVIDNTNPEYFNILVQVHDELLAEVPRDHVKKQDALMKEAMEDLNFDVPMLTDAKIGATSWAKLRKA
jgi:DNA polymerase-1